jgi:hypothetical protein
MDNLPQPNVQANAAMIRQAGLNLQTLAMTYKKKGKGSVAIQVKDYHGLEPYEIRDGYLFAFDPAAGHIKKFCIRDDNPSEGILFVKVEEGSVFSPRWPLKM